jgi:hypothetical protein
MAVDDAAVRWNSGKRARRATAVCLATSGAVLAFPPGASADDEAQSIEHASSREHERHRPRLQWVRQFGTGEYTAVTALATDGADIYAFGDVAGELPGQTSAGGPGDVFLRKYDRRGRLLWTRQFGSAGWDFAALALAARDGVVYVAGGVEGDLPGRDLVRKRRRVPAQVRRERQRAVDAPVRHGHRGRHPRGRPASRPRVCGGMPVARSARGKARPESGRSPDRGSLEVRGGSGCRRNMASSRSFPRTSRLA